MTTALLIEEPPLQVLPSLAAKVGLNEAIVVQQLHWLLRRDSTLVVDDRRWLKASLADWRKVFPFWSERTIKRTFADLKTAGLVETSRGRESNVYSLDYTALALVTGQLGPSQGPTWPVQTGQDGPSPCKREERQREHLEASSASPSLPGMEAPASSPSPERDLVAELWDHYAALFGDRMRVKELTPPRRRTLQKGLNAVGAAAAPDAALALCKRAASGLKSWRTSHPQGSQDVSPSVIFETGPHSGKSLTDQIEWWADQSDSETAVAHPGASSVLTGRINERRLTVVKMHQQPENSSLRDRGEQALAWLIEHAQEEPILTDGLVSGWRKIGPPT